MDGNELEGAARDVKGKLKDGYGGLTGDVGTQAEGKLDQAAGKLQGQFGDAVDGAKEAAGSAADFAARAGEKLRDAAETVRAEAVHAGEAVLETGAKAGEYVGRTVQQQPLLSLIGIGALGYLAAFLLHSPSSPLAPRPPARLSERLAQRLPDRFRS